MLECSGTGQQGPLGVLLHSLDSFEYVQKLLQEKGILKIYMWDSAPSINVGCI